MICPKCSGKTSVIDGVDGKPNSIKYRRRKCLVCSYIFYTSETVIEYDYDLDVIWHKNYRKKKKEQSK